MSYAILRIGANDFALWNGTYEAIYSGSLSGQALTDKINAIASSAILAMTTVKNAGSVNLIVDISLIPRYNHRWFPNFRTPLAVK